jgi:hypothetical protein
MAAHTLDADKFRAMFPEFAGVQTPAITGYWEMATAYLSPNDGAILSGAALQTALNMMTAHLAKSSQMIAAGQAPTVMQSATEGSVSVSMVPPPAKTGWQWWLASTPYGQQLWGFLQMKAAGGFYVGGSLERSAFRKAGGYF